jgi:transposase
MPEAAVARAVLAADLALLADLDTQIAAATVELARLVPLSPFATLTTVPGWGPVRVGHYGGALGDPSRFDNPRQVYRSAGLNPIQYESAGKRRDSVISREGSVELRRALIDLGLGLWLTDPAAKAHAADLKARGKKGGMIACAMAHRADSAMADIARCYAASSLAPGSFAIRQPERGQMTPRGRIHQRGRQAPLTHHTWPSTPTLRAAEQMPRAPRHT